jgi:hypothetical protein
MDGDCHISSVSAEYEPQHWKSVIVELESHSDPGASDVKRHPRKDSARRALLRSSHWPGSRETGHFDFIAYTSVLSVF